MGSCLSADSGGPSPRAPASSDVGDDGRQMGRGRRGSTSDSRTEMALHREPGRIFLNGSSEVASIYSKQGKKGVNQDAMIVWEKFGLTGETILCGVFDGHGPHGHMVAKKVRDSLPLKLRAQWEMINANMDGFGDVGSSSVVNNCEDTASSQIDETPGTSSRHQPRDIHTDSMILKEALLKSFKIMDKELKVHHTIDCYSSGTTAVTLVKEGEYLVIGNVGDSRAVLGTRDKDNCLNAVQLTVDLKPDLPEEAERIRMCKGRVFALPSEPDVARVWLPNRDTPGLAMARAFGDFCLKDYGLISVPEVFCHHLTAKDEFVILATDGIWDVLSNNEVVDIVASAPRSKAARSLVEKAARAWRVKYPYVRADDCAVVCLFLNPSFNNNSAPLISSEKSVISVNQAGLRNGKVADVAGSVDFDDSGTIIMSSLVNGAKQARAGDS